MRWATAKLTAGEDFGVISAELDELYKAISGLTDQTSQETYDKQVNSACTNLAATLRSYASGWRSITTRP